MFLSILTVAAPNLFLTRAKVLISSLPLLWPCWMHYLKCIKSSWLVIFLNHISNALSKAFHFKLYLFVCLFIFENEISHLVNIVCIFVVVVVLICVTVLWIWIYSHICSATFSLMINPIFFTSITCSHLIYHVINPKWSDNLIRNSSYTCFNHQQKYATVQD